MKQYVFTILFTAAVTLALSWAVWRLSLRYKLYPGIRERDIHIEMCPTSNLKTGSVKSIETHPIQQARELGMNFSVNTDDPGPFENSMLSEYQLLAARCGFLARDFHAIFSNALRSRFQPELRITPPFET